MYNAVKGIIADIALADIGMTVFSCTALVFAVVDVEYSNLLLSDEAVKVSNDSVKVADDIITGIVCVTCIKADAESVRSMYTVIDAGEFFKARAEFGTLAGHGFQGNADIRNCRKYLVESANDILDTDFRTGAYVGTRMQN